MRERRVATLVAGAMGASAFMVAAAGPAWAHGVHRTGESVWSFLTSGISHMLLGWDHLLFVAGVALVSGHVRQAAKLLSLFALGHSTTLIIASLAGWQVNAVFVDVVIALSLVFVGVVGWRGAPRFRWFALIVFGFGLIHGLGLATRLQALGLPDDGLLIRVIAFNVGVEIAQLIAILIAVALWKLALHRLDGTLFRRLSYAGLALVGLLAALTLTLTGMTAEDSPPASAHATSTRSSG
jgi:hydrogenase/urease accessory protein HupE